MSRGAWAVALALVLGAARAEAQYRHRVVLLQAPGDESAEVPVRLRGELGAAGFEVVVLPVPSSDGLKRAVETTAGELHPAAVLYVAPPAPDDESALGEIWISDRLLRRTLVVRFRADPDAPKNEAARASVQAVETLRADLAELSVTREARPAPPPKAPPAPPAPKRAPPPPKQRGAELEVHAGLGFLQGSARVPTTWTPVLRAGARLPESWLGSAPVGLSVLASAAAFGGQSRITASEGEARVEQAFVGMEVVLGLAPRESIQPFFAATGGAYGVNVAGAKAEHVHAETTWSMATGGGAGVRAALSPGFALEVSGEVVVAWARTEIRIAEQRAATAGAPVALLSAAAVGVF